MRRISRFARNAGAWGTVMTATLAVGVSAFLGLYMGCYVWLLSDPRIGRSED